MLIDLSTVTILPKVGMLTVVANTMPHKVGLNHLLIITFLVLFGFNYESMIQSHQPHRQHERCGERDVSAPDIARL